jgi:hypothetical protein
LGEHPKQLRQAQQKRGGKQVNPLERLFLQVGGKFRGQSSPRTRPLAGNCAGQEKKGRHCKTAQKGVDVEQGKQTKRDSCKKKAVPSIFLAARLFRIQPKNAEDEHCGRKARQLAALGQQRVAYNV